MDGSAFITWEQLKTFPGQVFAITALTGILYRMLRARWPDTPEAVVQAIALIISIATNLLTTYQVAEGAVAHQWVLLGVFNGVVVGTVVIKSIDWITTAKTNTGAPQAGLPEKPPAWFVAELAKGTTVVPSGPVAVERVENVVAQIKANDAAVAKAVETKEVTP